MIWCFFFFQAEDGIRDLVRSRGLGDVYKRQVVFWLFFIRPQAKRAKNQKNFTENLQKGDKIVTIAGIHGTINKVNDDGTTLNIETSPGSYIKIEKSAISMDWTTALNKPAAEVKK